MLTLQGFLRQGYEQGSWHLKGTLSYKKRQKLYDMPTTDIIMEDNFRVEVVTP